MQARRQNFCSVCAPTRKTARPCKQLAKPLSSLRTRASFGAPVHAIDEVPAYFALPCKKLRARVTQNPNPYKIKLPSIIYLLPHLLSFSPIIHPPSPQPPSTIHPSRRPPSSPATAQLLPSTINTTRPPLHLHHHQHPSAQLAPLSLRLSSITLSPTHHPTAPSSNSCPPHNPTASSPSSLSAAATNTSSPPSPRHPPPPFPPLHTSNSRPLLHLHSLSLSNFSRPPLPLQHQRHPFNLSRPHLHSRCLHSSSRRRPITLSPTARPPPNPAHPITSGADHPQLLPAHHPTAAPPTNTSPLSISNSLPTSKSRSPLPPFHPSAAAASTPVAAAPSPSPSPAAALFSTSIIPPLHHHHP